MINRLLEPKIKAKFFQGKALIIAGPRQVGKTMLVKKILEPFPANEIVYFNCDNPTDRQLLNNQDLDFLKKLVGDARFVFIDEGQKVVSIGQTLKLLVDYYQTQKQIIVTGSSSIHLLNQTQEALTGRKFVFQMFPLSWEEMYPAPERLAFFKEIDSLLIFGQYPEVFLKSSFVEKRELLQELSSSYLYKDVLELYKIKNSDVVANLLKALALQLGSDVSYTELSRLIGIDRKTIEHYINILEQAYVIFKVAPYTGNKRKEITKLKKIYFYDVGMRNAIINNFNFLPDRNDAGALWENILMVERLKYREYHGMYANSYFWRTYNGSEVDLVEEREGKLFGYEFKWNNNAKKRRGPPAAWSKYDNSSYVVIDKENLDGFVR